MPEDGDRYVENPDFVWIEKLGMWIYQPEGIDADHRKIQEVGE
jgi:hypothetical protein